MARLKEREERLQKVKMDSGEGNKVELITFGDPTDSFYRDNKVESDHDIVAQKENEEQGIYC